ncbi:MAG TPA: hypothetical protein VHS31_07540 [Tepidisphaeraceae bacterium]|nr:hypothetical protein [Tepidisphaeraceae bacterium]
MGATYIPRKEQDLSAWALNFSTLIAASPARYGLASADALTIEGVCSAFITSLVAASDPATQTKPTVAAKDAAREAMLPVVRQYAQQIRINAGVSNEDKSALGLNLPNHSRSPVAAPSTSPTITLIGATPGEITARFADTNTPTRRAMPAGALGLLVFVAIDSNAVADPSKALFRAFITRQPFALAFESIDAGKVATVFGRWMNRKGELGPWSNAASMRIVA